MAETSDNLSGAYYVWEYDRETDLSCNDMGGFRTAGVLVRPVLQKHDVGRLSRKHGVRGSGEEGTSQGTGQDVLIEHSSSSA